MPIITHFTILAWITHKHQTPLLQCFFTQNWWLNFPASVNVSAANWSWLTVKLILHPWPFPSFSCSSMTQQKQPDALWWLWRQAGQGRRVGRICLSEAIRLRKGMKWNRKSIYGRRSAAGSRAEKTTWRLNPTAGMIALLACQFGIWYASVSALTMFDLIQFSLCSPSSQQELPQGALYCKPKILMKNRRVREK